MFNFTRPRFNTTTAPLMLKDMLRAEATIDLASIAAAASGTATVTVTGARVGDDAVVCPEVPTAGLVYAAYVSADDTVTVRATNVTASPINEASSTYRVIVFKN